MTESVSEWVIVSDSEIAITFTELASLFNIYLSYASVSYSVRSFQEKLHCVIRIIGIYANNPCHSIELCNN